MFLKSFRKMRMNCGEQGGTTKRGKIIQINTYIKDDGDNDDDDNADKNKISIKCIQFLKIK